MALHVHRAERTDLLADGLGACWPSRCRPVRGGAGPGAGARRRALAEPAAVARPGRRRQRRRRLRGSRVPQPGLADRGDHRHRRRRPVVAGRHGVAAARGDRRVARRAVVPHLGHAPRPLRRRRGGRTAPGPALRRGAAPGRAVRVLRPATPAAARRLARRQPPGPRRRPALAARAVARARRRACTPTPRTSGSRRPLRGCRKGRPTCPQRLSLFGHTRLACTEIELLQALATHHDLHLWLPHPSDDAVARARPASTAPSPVATTPATARWTIRCWPRSGATCANCSAACRRICRPTNTCATRGPRDTLLGWLQSDIAANAVRPQGRTLAPDDRSVQVHGCHGPARQVDVLREVLLGLLADDPTLEPRDILVMCPDIETYAPLIDADFGLGDVVHGAHPAHRLRVQLADRSLVQTNPLLGVASQLLALAGSRVTASEVLNLAAGRAGARPLRLHRRRPGDDHPLGPAGQHPLGLRPGTPAAVSASTSSTTPGVSASTGSWPASRCPTTRTPGSAPRCRSTTSAATASSWPASSPSSSTGCSGPSTR